MKLLNFKSKLSKRLFWFFITPSFLFSLLIFIIYLGQDHVIQGHLDVMNKSHVGLIKIGDTHLAPFESFPDVSFKIDDVKIYESKKQGEHEILDVEDIYVNFNVWDVLTGNYNIKSLVIEEGFFNVILHKDGSTNIERALKTAQNVTDSSALNVHLKKVELLNLDIHKFDEATNVDVETFIFFAEGGFKTGEGLINAHIDTEFELSIFNDKDTTYVHNKHFEFHTDVTVNESTGLIVFKPSGITMEHGDFDLVGSLDTKNEMTIDLEVKGTKPNFDMLIAFAPEDLIPTLENYNNEGDIYFNAVIKGATSHGKQPFIDAVFGADEAFLENKAKGKKVDHLGFQGHFTNGDERSLKTMEFSLSGMSAQLEKGNFKGSVFVKNFEEPELDMELDADFNIDFLADFLNFDDIQDASGSVLIKMKFHDIIDLDNPEHALKDLNQAYFSEVKIDNLQLNSASLPAPLKNLDIHLVMNGKKAKVNQFEMLLGQSDLSIKGDVSNLPAIVHHTNIPVTAHLEIMSNVLDIAELTKFSEKDSLGVDERIEDLSVGFTFVSSAKAFTESEYLPKGEFFIDSLHAQLKHYPHELHDFHADVLIGDRDLEIIDFKGDIDKSDFHFNGLIHEYEFWMQPELNGDVDLDITLSSNLLKLEDIFSYQGENYVPEDYRHEEFDGLKLHVNSSMHYKDSHLHAIDVDLDKLTAKMHLHPMRFENFNGRFHYEDEHLMVQKFHGKIGQTEFVMDMNYYLGNNVEVRKRDNHFGLKANYINVDELTNFNLTANSNNDKDVVKTKSDVPEHAEAFNIYELPFTDMTFDVEVDHFIQHRIDLKDIKATARTTEQHYLYIDTLSMGMAGGFFAMSGYFNGSDPKHIYMKPNINITDCDIDKLLFKFENFGQDAVVSDNLHGKLSAHIEGKIRVYPDLVADLDQSEVHVDARVLNGRLVNYEPMLLMSDYFDDRHLTNLLFDTLENKIDITNGMLTIPNMTLASTIGHMEFSGTQTMDDEIEYYVRVPWSVIGKGARNKLFGVKNNKENEPLSTEIKEIDKSKKIRYLNLKISGTLDDYKIKTGKRKSKS